MPLDVLLRRRNAEAMHVLLDELQVFLLPSRGFGPGASTALTGLRFGQNGSKAMAPRAHEKDSAVREAHCDRVAGGLGYLGYDQPGELIGQRPKVQPHIHFSHVAHSPLSAARGGSHLRLPDVPFLTMPSYRTAGGANINGGESRAVAQSTQAIPGRVGAIPEDGRFRAAVGRADQGFGLPPSNDFGVVLHAQHAHPGPRAARRVARGPAAYRAVRTPG